jgi:hypothetical protein
MFFLRHLITLDQEKKFNLPFIILNHMKSALSSKVACLPYGHLIQRIIQMSANNSENDIPTSPGLLLQPPIHLIDLLTKYGWRQGISESALPLLKPDSRPINRWIIYPNARPNQYWDPNNPEPVPVELPQVGDANQVPPQAGQNDFPQAFTQQMAALVEQMRQMNENQGTMSKRIQRMSVRIKKNTEAIKSIDEVQTDLVKRCVRFFGSSNASTSQAPQDDEDDEDDEDNEDDENEDGMDEDDDDGIAPN